HAENVVYVLACVDQAGNLVLSSELTAPFHPLVEGAGRYCVNFGRDKGKVCLALCVIIRIDIPKASVKDMGKGGHVVRRHLEFNNPFMSAAFTPLEEHGRSGEVDYDGACFLTRRSYSGLRVFYNNLFTKCIDEMSRSTGNAYTIRRN